VKALTRIALGAAWAVLSPAEHLYNFSEKTLARILQRTGFSSVRFQRDYDGVGVYETMNPRYTHQPSSLRTRMFAQFVAKIGPSIFRQVQRAGRADTLLATASAAS
jgi:hypothetical protein